VTSERKIAANRMNGRKSRGPMSAAGKARARNNALRHGLAAMPRAHPAAWAKIERMAKAICAGDHHPLLFERALLIAADDFVLRRVCTERVAVIERLRHGKVRALGDTQTPKQRDEAEAMREGIAELRRLDRYERRAWPRLKRAVRAWSEVKSEGEHRADVLAAQRNWLKRNTSDGSV
jgi:hypothetical protein